MEKIYGIKLEAKWQGLRTNPSATVKELHAHYNASSSWILVKASDEHEAYAVLMKPIASGRNQSAFAGMPDIKSRFVSHDIIDAKCGKDLAKATGFSMEQLEKLVGED